MTIVQGLDCGEAERASPTSSGPRSGVLETAQEMAGSTATEAKCGGTRRRSPFGGLQMHGQLRPRNAHGRRCRDFLLSGKAGRKLRQATAKGAKGVGGEVVLAGRDR